MQANKTVTINGRIYDAVTGLPVEKKPAAKSSPAGSGAAKRAGSGAASIHTSTQRSQTLHRRAAKKAMIAKRPQPGRHMDISRSTKVARFAAHPVTTSRQPDEKPDVKPKTHPAVSRANSRVEAKKAAAAPKTSKQVKEAAISAALAAPTLKPVKPKRFNWRWSRRFTIITVVFAILIFGALLTYINLPVLSVGFASAQAGIDATYPEFKPDGFRLDQPVTFKDGEVSLKFVSNSGTGEYVIKQSRSSWDSTAVLNNVVQKAAGDNYITTQERGLKIYTYEGNAAWVNAGILYEIQSSAPLSGEQIRRIATSM